MRYSCVAENQKLAKFMLARKLGVEFDERDRQNELWRMHDASVERFFEFQRHFDREKAKISDVSDAPRSFLDLKIAIAKCILRSCHFCTRGCGVNRSEEKLGYCRCGKKMKVSNIFAHFGEEPELVPSGTIFTMGCTIRCKHCQNWTISQWHEEADSFGLQQLAQEVNSLRKQGCRNANLVGGEPTPWLSEWLGTFKHVRANIPVVWNSNAYYSADTARLLAGFADVYLLDFKYGPGKCAEIISDAPDYWDNCTRNHLEAKRYGELIVRVLVLPDHLECCTRPILHWIAKILGTGTRVNLMFQYRPEWKASELQELNRRLTAAEMTYALRIADDAGLRNMVR